MRKVGQAGKVISSILIFAICITSLAGCGKKKSGNSLEEAKQIDKNCIFKQEDFEGILEPGEKADIIEIVGDKVKVITRSEKGKNRCISFNKDGSDVQSIDINTREDVYISSCAFDNDGNIYVNTIEGIVDDRFADMGGAEDAESEADATSSDASASEQPDAGEDASKEASKDASASESSAAEEAKDGDLGENVADDGKSYLVKLDPTGKEIYKYELSKDFEGEDFDVSEIFWSAKYGLVCSTAKGIQAYDEQKGFEMLIDKKKIGDSIYIYNFAKLSDDKAVVTYYDEANYAGETNAIIDLEKKEVGKKLEGLSENAQYSFFAGTDGTLYAATDVGIFKYDLQASKLEKLLDYRDSNIGSGGWMSWIAAVAISDKEFIASIPIDTDNNMALVRLTKVNPEDIADKTIITMSTLWTDETIGSEIMKFNRNNDKYTIKIIDYNELYPDDWEEAEKQFNLDITSGKAADIINISGNESYLKKYVDKGIVLDLTSAFENGGPLADIEFLPNIDDMMKIDGKYYSFIPSFTVETYVVRSKFANGKSSLTYKDCDELIKSKGTDYDTAFGSFNQKSNMASYYWEYYGDKFIDWENKKCDFNNPEFIDLMNFINNFPDERKDFDSNDYIDPDTYYADDRGLFYNGYFYNMDEYARLKQVLFKDEIEFVGVPNNFGENLSSINAKTFVVNSKTSHQDIIFDFIRNLLEADRGAWGGFSSIKSKFDSELQEATKEKSDDDYDAYVYDRVAEKEVKIKPLTQEEVKKFSDFVLSINLLYSGNSEVSDIISEECSAFFSGQKTAEEVAEIIQNRVSVYINENS